MSTREHSRHECEEASLCDQHRTREYACEYCMDQLCSLCTDLERFELEAEYRAESDYIWEAYGAEAAREAAQEAAYHEAEEAEAEAEDARRYPGGRCAIEWRAPMCETENDPICF